MSEQVIKTVENVDKPFSQIIVNGETFISDKVVEQPKPVVKPSTKTETTTTTSTTPKASRTGEDVYAVDLNDVLHNFTDRTTKQNLTEEIRNRTEKDTAMQTELNTVKSSLNTVKASVEDIQALIPNQATKDNQLADKDFVNSSISTNTANFLGTFNTLEEIEALTDVTNNDYAFWKTTDTLGSVVFKRYKYIADEQLWKFEYDLNNSSFTAKQWDAINSGITEELVAQIGQGGGSALVPSITQEQYNNLTEAEKNNGQIREITNTNPKKVMLNGMDLNEQLDNEPIGAVISFGGSVIPHGYLLCNGQAVSRVDYTELFAVIGTAFGAGDGTTTFNLPDLREVVLVGAGQNEKLNIKEHDIYNIGEFKDDQMQGHKHRTRPQISEGSSDGVWKANVTKNTQSVAPDTSDPITDGVNGTPRTGSTTHGKQIGVNYIIKAIDTTGIVPSDIQLNDQKTTIGNVWSADKTKREINAKNNYSENEKVVGAFLDKPLYRKVFSDLNINIPSDEVTTLLTDTTIGTIDDLILCIGIGTEKSENSKCTTTFTKAFFGNGSLKTFSNIGFTINKLILEYTKTTD